MQHVYFIKFRKHWRTEASYCVVVAESTECAKRLIVDHVNNVSNIESYNIDDEYYFMISELSHKLVPTGCENEVLRIFDIND